MAYLVDFKARTLRISLETVEAEQLSRIDSETELLQRMRASYALSLTLKAHDNETLKMEKTIAWKAARLEVLKDVWDARVRVRVDVDFSEEERLRDQVLKILRDDYPRQISTKGFLQMFEDVKKRVDIDQVEVLLVLKLLVGQAYLHLANWGGEVGYAAMLAGSTSDQYYPVQYDYDSGYEEKWDEPRHEWQNCARKDCAKWFKNPNYVNLQEARRYKIPLIKFSWVTLDIATLVEQKKALMSVVRGVLSLEKDDTLGIDELFDGLCAYDCPTFNDPPALILLMRSVLHRVGKLIKSYELAPEPICLLKIMKYLRTPNIAHLDMIYDDGPGDEMSDEDCVEEDMEEVVTDQEDRSEYEETTTNDESDDEEVMQDESDESDEEDMKDDDSDDVDDFDSEC